MNPRKKASLSELLSNSAYHIRALRDNLHLHNILHECLTLIEGADEELAKQVEATPSDDGYTVPESPFEVAIEELYNEMVKFFYFLLSEYDRSSDIVDYFYPGANLGAIGGESTEYIVFAKTLITRSSQVGVAFVERWRTRFESALKAVDIASQTPTPSPVMAPAVAMAKERWECVYRSNRLIIKGLLARLGQEEREVEFFKDIPTA